MSGILLGLGQLAQPMALLALLGGVVIASWTERQHYHGSSDPDHIWHGAMRSHLSADRNLLCIRVRRLCTVYSVKDSGNCIRYCNSL